MPIKKSRAEGHIDEAHKGGEDATLHLLIAIAQTLKEISTELTRLNRDGITIHVAPSVAEKLRKI